MTGRWIALVPILLLAALAALTWWLDRTVQPLGPGHTNSADAPDFKVERFEAVRMNTDGTKHYELIAKSMVHYGDDNRAKLDEPQLFRYDPESATMSIRANQAFVASNGESADFIGDVHVQRAPYGQNREMSLLTSFLHVIPDQDLVETDREVTFISGNSTLNAVGLEFNNRTHELKLRSNVRGQFETPPRGRSGAPWERRH